MMELMARNGSILSPSDAKKRRLQEARSRPMPKAARMKLEMKMEPAAEEGPDSDEEMMALLDPGRSGIPSTENRKVQVGKLESNVFNIVILRLVTYKLQVPYHPWRLHGILIS